MPWSLTLTTVIIVAEHLFNCFAEELVHFVVIVEVFQQRFSPLEKQRTRRCYERGSSSIMRFSWRGKFGAEGVGFVDPRSCPSSPQEQVSIHPLSGPNWSSRACNSEAQPSQGGGKWSVLEPQMPNRSWYLRGKIGVCMLSLLRVLTVVSFLSIMSLRHVISTLALFSKANNLQPGVCRVRFLRPYGTLACNVIFEN